MSSNTQQRTLAAIMFTDMRENALRLYELERDASRVVPPAR